MKPSWSASREALRLGGPALTVLLLAGFGVGCATFPAMGTPSLRDEIDEILASPPLDQVNWGILVVDPDRGRIVYSRHSQLKFVPASNMKLISTAAALALLGPEYIYRTPVLGVGRPLTADGRLEGDLVVRASGDPTFSARFRPSAESALDSLAAQLARAGLRHVTGALVVDVSGWDSTTVPGSWMVQNLSGTSGATGGAFTVGEGIVSIEVRGGDLPGDPATVRWWPSVSDQYLSVAFTTASPDSSSQFRASYLPESHRLLVHGTLPVGRVDTFRVSQRDPVGFASELLLHRLEAVGITVRSGLRVAWAAGTPVGSGACVTGPDGVAGAGDPLRLGDCPEAFSLAELTSPPMAAIVKATLEPSQNWIAEQLVRTVGAERRGRGSWRQGFQAELEFLTGEVGIDSLDVVLRDGSGLSAYNLLTPRAVVRLLEWMRTSPYSGPFRDALASPGEGGSTLERRLTSLSGHLFAKTGTITHVNSLSGYLFTQGGHELIFSILTNGSGLPARPVRDAIDSVLKVLDRY